MVIKSMKRSHKYCRIVAYTPEYVYNVWVRYDTVHFYVLSNDKKADVLYHFIAHIGCGEIQLMADEVAITLYSNDELINTVKYEFPNDMHNDVITILETLLYEE